MVVENMAPRDFLGQRLCIGTLLGCLRSKLVVSWDEKRRHLTSSHRFRPAVHLVNTTVILSLARTTARAIMAIRSIKAKSYLVYEKHEFHCLWVLSRCRWVYGTIRIFSLQWWGLILLSWVVHLSRSSLSWTELVSWWRCTRFLIFVCEQWWWWWWWWWKGRISHVSGITITYI